jgi:hypothetical protein
VRRDGHMPLGEGCGTLTRYSTLRCGCMPGHMRGMGAVCFVRGVSIPLAVCIWAGSARRCGAFVGARFTPGFGRVPQEGQGNLLLANSMAAASDSRSHRRWLRGFTGCTGTACAQEEHAWWWFDEE